MEKLHEGQCGLCRHFGEEHPDDFSLVKIRETKEASENYSDECGHPQHAALRLVVTPQSGCAGFEPAAIHP